MPLFQLLNMDQREFDSYMDSTQPTPKPTQNPTTQPTQPMLTTGRHLVAEAMDRLKRIITTHPALVLPERGNDDFMVWTDASDYALEGTLRQMQDGEEKILTYFSQKLHGAETRYATYDKELLAIRDCLKHWRHYLL
jgi:hypothetical protein